ncbi:MAG: ATP-binding cassette domain-containing protein [Candidatus Omnitrophica bacterium]|nr:ATP-binding cassette domain-containing protein [Candidatus Omnitrophota bacterium]MDD5352346.1 ATP-binding cassette domain-containing protein [Candidatus Omnitrophota bacterium]MDD5549944.1 ATP-binding cassette domain-containing protein [Candidatus Omnitrophota bacterium]
MLLRVENLGKQYAISKSFFSNKETIVQALDNINFELREGTILGVLGETGSGKTTLAKLIVKLLEPNNGKIIYNFDNFPRNVQMVFQNPFSSLNPMMKIKDILKEPFLIHHLDNGTDTDSKLRILLEKVNLSYDCLKHHPDEFSGGQRQRIAIARAIAIEPKVLVCDEPTASLDLSVQAQILNLFIKLKEELGLSYIFISHNIEVISFIADEVLILYEGKPVERGLKNKVFNNPLHPYTKILLSSDIGELQKTSAQDNYSGCKFYTNCKFSSDICKQMTPEEIKTEEGHYVSCHILK